MPIFKSVRSVFLFKQVSLLCVLFSSVLLARILGPDGRGILAALLVVPNLISAISEAGMRQSAVYFIGKRINVNETISNLMIYMIIVGLLGSMVSLLYFYFVMDLEISILILSISVMVIGNLLSNGMRGVFLGFGDIKTYNNYIVAQNISILLLLTVFYFLGISSVNDVSLIYVIANISTATIIVFKVFNRYVVDFEFSPSFIFARKMLSKSIVYGVVFALIVINYKSDILMLTHMSEEIYLGYYTISTQIVELLWQIPGALVVVFFSASANSKTTPTEVCKATRVTVFLVVFLSIFLSFFGNILITLFFGLNFSDAYWSLLFLLPGAILMVPFKIIYANLAGEGKPLAGLYIMLFAVLINIFVNFLLIPKYNEIGAAIASSLSYTVAGFFMAYSFSKKIERPLKDILFIKFEDFNRAKKNDNIT